MRGRDDGGQLMMLAGIVLTLSFILTALTLSQVSALEKQAASDAPTPIISEWRFLHERLASNLRTAVTPETTQQSFRDSVLPTLSATFRALAAEKGYDFVLRLAGDGHFAGNGNEESLLDEDDPSVYDATTFDGTVHFDHPVDDDIADGFLMQDPCPDETGPLVGCIGGVLLYMRLADATTSVEESVLFAVNQ